MYLLNFVKDLGIVVQMRTPCLPVCLLLKILDSFFLFIKSFTTLVVLLDKLLEEKSDSIWELSVLCYSIP